MKSRCFKLFRAYSNSLNSSNVGTFFPELNSKRLYRSSGKDKESHYLEFTSSTKRKIRHFLVVVVPWRQRNVQKKRDARTDLLLCQSKPISFLPFSLTSSPSYGSITYAEVIINMDWTPLSTICLRQESSQPKSRLDWQTTYKLLTWREAPSIWRILEGGSP